MTAEQKNEGFVPESPSGERDGAGVGATAALTPVMVTVSADDLVLAFRAAGNVQATEEQYDAAERLFVAARSARIAIAKALGGAS